ncbi:MAG: phosphopantothenoylcysteine decarboxylase [Candidatus Magasanikbacteria bacterium]|nr:phosphopantothenoylcysteine decarboxylase [Candidatus Magasanikbacteria bacterium]
MKILLGVTGSVAGVLTKKLVDALQDSGHEVRVVLTRAAEYFVPRKCLYVPVYDETDEWSKERYEKGDEVLHITLRDWADMLLIAPLTANTLAKLSQGRSDNLLTCIFLAWDKSKPVILAPAMNTKMWEHPVTRRNLKFLVSDLGGSGYTICVLDPIAKKLACGEEGVGAMVDISTIVTNTNRFFS